ncbi:uncharacterized protein LOC113528027 [Pangasianodon hypophthalmus]|uniref:uncharacterized protein LOC113528027 n=1 Tax=Pangasianodon hypophthalmus TaxID=310915 RepID=UPI0023081211|nr:uncharacterized protein LOC113528027 [Pangasianodon hypophthalmus]XP_053085163.1 uncharacterized protein LOC113528027 [Pangasianodon hypophthalmus]
MQSCSIHHCVLFFLTLTFTTEPTLALTSVMVKLNQSAGLPCEQNCSGSLQWTVIDKPSDIVAQCNQTSCWSGEGFYISHDQYLKGDLSLTITVADYINRGLYTCECDGEDIINTVRLSIEPRTLYIHLKPGEVLVMDVHLPGLMELTYKPKDSTDPYGERICNVTQHSLQCKAEYRPRVKLSDADLILKNVKPSDSGVYIIWDKQNNDINLNYIVSVKEPLEAPVIVKHHGTVTLPCTRNCTGLVEWTHRDDVVAWCNQTSKPCYSKEGYEMSHEQYLKGDFALTITADDYNMRGWYECKCNDKRIIIQRVIIETENSSVQLKPGEDLLMDLPATEPVEVIYNGSVIWSNGPTNKQLCKGDYTHRLLQVLKLEKVNVTDSGVYTIRDMNNKEVLLIYNVSVKEDHSAPLGLTVGLPIAVAFILFLGVLYWWFKNSHPQMERVRNDI